jgi:hypothetical protein
MVKSMSKSKSMKGGSCKRTMKGGAKKVMKGGAKKVMKGGSCKRTMKGGAKKVMKGGSNCGLLKPLMNGGAKKVMKGGSCGCKKSMKGGAKKVMKGGSPASDHVMSVCNATGEQVAAPVAPQVKGVPEHLNLYQTTGGGKRTKSKKSKKMSKLANKRGGGATDFRDVLYSRPYDGFRADEAPFFGKFTSSEFLSPAELINEPNTVAHPPFLK